jgi:hypothetical protein
MGLELYYVLTAHQHTDNTFDAATEQKLMGLALKTLHDNPVITDATQVLAQPVISGDERGRGNRLNIELRKIEPDQAFAIWTTGERQFTRLAAYYQVGLVMLEPQPPQRVPGIVLNLGAFVSPGAAPQLSASFSDLAFTLPPAAGGGLQKMRAQPARPFLLAVPGSDATLTVQGDQMGAGSGRRITLRNARWQALTPAVDRVPLDATRPANQAAGWQLVFQAARFGMRFAPSLQYQPDDGSPPRTLALFPGTYLLQLEIDVPTGAAASAARPLRLTSNQIAIALCPRITGHALLGPNSLRIDLDPAFTLLPGVPAQPLEIQLVVGGQVYRRIDIGPPLAGEFIAGASDLTLTTPFSTVAASLHSVQLAVEGADAQPYWITTP